MKLTIGILVSNRINSVKRCLDSVKPLLDKGIAELICVDTVTETQGMVSDGSADIAREYTSKVYTFKWIKDFSAARNVTLDHAEGEWYLFLDDDEWFDDVTEIDKFFTSNEYLNYNSASYITRNYKNKAGTEWGDQRVVRAVKRTNELRFHGTIHENFSIIKLPCKDLSVFTHHYGYAFEDEEEKRAHIERNTGLLKEEIERFPLDLRLRTQMALELASFDNDRALKYVNEILDKFEKSKGEPYYQWLVALKFRLYAALGFDLKDVEAEYEKISQEINLFEFAKLAIHYQLTRIWLLHDNRVKAVLHIPSYFENLKFLNENPDKAQMQNTADFERFLSNDTVSEMKKYEEYCMSDNNDTIKIGNGTITFGEKRVTVTGTTEEKLQQLDDLGFEEFCIAVNRLIKETSACFDDEFLNAAVDYFSQNNQIEYCFLLYRMVEEEIKRAVERGTTGEAISELFVECICTERKMYESIYKPEVFTEKGFKWVSSEVRYNDILYRFVSGGGKELKLCLEAAKIRPDMANVIKIWLGALK